MDFGMVFQGLGLLLQIIAEAMVPSFIVALIYGQGDGKPILMSIVITFIAGSILRLFKSKRDTIRYREGFMIVGAGWVLASLFGALPFYLSGYFGSYINCFFEIVSGFTTTGSTILNEVESIPKGILFWRSFSHWIGGMGILLFAMALLPSMGGGSLLVYRAETTGPQSDKIVPKMKETAKILYSVYLLITVLQVIVLLIAGMPLYDSLVHTFGTVGTGGFSIYNNSIGHYNNPTFEWIITIFTFISGVNFSLYYDFLHGKLGTLFKDKEFRLYSFIVVSSILLIAANLTLNSFFDWAGSIRHSSFQVMTIMSTTGYSTTNFNLWPAFSKFILFILMYIGSCAGSTAGGMKVVRVLLVFKLIKREFYKILHPNAVIPIRVGNKTISEDTLRNTTSFLAIYILIAIVSTLILLTQGMDIQSGASAVAATLNNVGPGFGMVGPYSSFGGLTNLSKILLSLLMLLGRLEIFTLLILLSPSFWKN